MDKSLIKNKLTNEEIEICINKGTEPAFSGKYNNFYEQGTFICKCCDQKLFTSLSKFNSDLDGPVSQYLLAINQLNIPRIIHTV